MRAIGTKTVFASSDDERLIIVEGEVEQRFRSGSFTHSSAGISISLSTHLA
jgi:hypothetical protein